MKLTPEITVKVEAVLSQKYFLVWRHFWVAYLIKGSVEGALELLQTFETRRDLMYMGQFKHEGEAVTFMFDEGSPSDAVIGLGNLWVAQIINIKIEVPKTLWATSIFQNRSHMYGPGIVTTY